MNREPGSEIGGFTYQSTHLTYDGKPAFEWWVAQINIGQAIPPGLPDDKILEIVKELQRNVERDFRLILGREAKKILGVEGGFGPEVYEAAISGKLP